jgi:hypothetical protein
MDESKYVVQLKTTGFQNIPLKVYKVLICLKPLYQTEDEEWDTLAFVISEEIYDGRHLRFFWNKRVSKDLDELELREVRKSIPEFRPVRAGTTIIEYFFDSEQKKMWWI